MKITLRRSTCTKCGYTNARNLKRARVPGGMSIEQEMHFVLRGLQCDLTHTRDDDKERAQIKIAYRRAERCPPPRIQHASPYTTTFNLTTNITIL